MKFTIEKKIGDVTLNCVLEECTLEEAKSLYDHINSPDSHMPSAKKPRSLDKSIKEALEKLGDRPWTKPSVYPHQPTPYWPNYPMDDSPIIYKTWSLV